MPKVPIESWFNHHDLWVSDTLTLRSLKGHQKTLHFRVGASNTHSGIGWPCITYTITTWSHICRKSCCVIISGSVVSNRLKICSQQGDWLDTRIHEGGVHVNAAKAAAAGRATLTPECILSALGTGGEGRRWLISCSIQSPVSLLATVSHILWRAETWDFRVLEHCENNINGCLQVYQVHKLGKRTHLQRRR